MKGNTLVQLGMDSDAPSTTQNAKFFNGHVNDDDRKDFFIVKDGVKFAGTHLILDLYEAEGLDDLERVEKALNDCVETAGATLLHIHLHHFEPNGGISAVAVLAESHISMHSWPESGYAAFDVFMCGAAKPELCVDVLRKAFNCKRLVVSDFKRGRAL